MNAQYLFDSAEPGEGISYSVRESPRARHVRLRVSFREGLVVVVPRGFDTRLVPGIVRERLPWIRRALEKTAVEEPPGAGTPGLLRLQSVGEEWTVLRKSATGARSVLRERPGRVVEIRSLRDDPAASRDLLLSWVRRKASAELLPRLAARAEAYGFRYGRGAVRHQKTRWGSCSAKGTISLNMKLLFLPPELVDYILLHELCHTVHMDHSRCFWALVERHMSDFRERDRAMKEAFRHVPRFAL